MNVPIGVLLILMVRAKIEETRGPERAIDLPGVGLVTAALAALAWGLVRAARFGWVAPDVMAGTLGGLLLGVAFIAWERRAPRPTLD